MEGGKNSRVMQPVGSTCSYSSLSHQVQLTHDSSLQIDSTHFLRQQVQGSSSPFLLFLLLLLTTVLTIITLVLMLLLLYLMTPLLPYLGVPITGRAAVILHSLADTAESGNWPLVIITEGETAT